jgi:hypothetical protein
MIACVPFTKILWIVDADKWYNRCEVIADNIINVSDLVNRVSGTLAANLYGYLARERW